MSALENPKLEQFCQHLANGMKQGKAYVMSGYSHNPAAASRMAKREDVKLRVEEIKVEREAAITVIIGSDDPMDPENLKTMEELGLTLDWCANAYKNVYEQAIKMGQLSAANTAVEKIQKIIDGRSGDGDDANSKSTPPAVENLKEMRGLLGDMARIIREGGADAPPEHVMKNGTPAELELPGPDDFDEGDDDL